MASLFLLVFFLLALGASHFEKTDNSLITIGIINNGEVDIIDSLTELIKDTPSISSFCKIKEYTDDEAIQDLKNQKLDMVIDVPDDFYQKASKMEETVISIYIDGAFGKQEKKLIALIEGVEDLMLTTEGAIYAMYDGMNEYSFPVSRAQIEYSLFMDTISDFYDRAENYELVNVSPYGDVSFFEYYFVTALFVITSICSVTFFGMYSDGDVSLERIYGRRAGKYFIPLSKIISMTIPTGLFVSGIVIIFNIISSRLELLNMHADAKTFVTLWLFAFSVSTLVNMVVIIMGYSGRTRTFFWLLISILFVMSGIVVPKVYLPMWINKISVYLESTSLFDLVLKGLWYEARRKVLTNGLNTIIITNVILIILSSLIYGRRINGHD